ncbi:hypothetical protein ACQKL5_13905 [Peribacillus sp. NPDC097675]|uniref:hypothetical protein n=1 Tax=Peribacillus sp. NPDC097675 TaxID=3390618 RepID=UPI003D05E3BE
MELETLLDQEYSSGFNPDLAETIGLSKAVMLAHLHTLIETCGVERDGRDWIVHTYRYRSGQRPPSSGPFSVLKKTAASFRKITTHRR